MTTGRGNSGTGPARARLRALGLALGLLAGCASHDRRLPTRPSSGEARPEQALAAAEAGNWELAANRWYEIFLREDQHSAQACLGTARALLHLGDAESAKGVLDQGLRRHPKDPELLEMSGNVLAQMGFRRAAESCYEEALRLAPESSSTLLALARVRLDLGLELAALRCLDRRIELGADDSETWCCKAQAHQARGEVAEAYEAYARAFARGDNRVAELVRAAGLYMQSRERGRNVRAEELTNAWLHEALAMDPQSTVAHFYLGVLYEDLQQERSAEDHYRRAVETDPGCLAALTNLACLYSRRGDRENAAVMVERALKLERDPARRDELKRLLSDS